MNKKGHEVNEIEVNEDEAVVVRKIFDLYITKGYGPQRISTQLTKQGIMTRKGDNFTNVTICNMLKNKSYIGILKSGDTESEIFDDLQIISPKVFEEAQEIRHQRSVEMQEERRIPLNTTGSTMLSGNVFCGHCGARLIVTTNVKKYVRKDGSVNKKTVTRYVCYNKTRHKRKCDGQTGYTTAKLDRIVGDVVRDLFAKIRDLPKEAIVEQRFNERISEHQIALTQAKAAMQADTAEMTEYETEVLKIIRGESQMETELLNKLYEQAKSKVAVSSERVRSLEENLESCEHLKESLSDQFDEIQSWSDVYDGCDLASKKMILSRMFHSVKVRRDYEIVIDVATSCEQLGILLDEAGNCETEKSMLGLAGQSCSTNMTLQELPTEIRKPL